LASLGDGIIGGLSVAFGAFFFLRITHSAHAMLVLRKKEHHPHIHKVPVG
jgi:hypothetical protein